MVPAKSYRTRRETLWRAGGVSPLLAAMDQGADAPRSPVFLRWLLLQLPVLPLRPGRGERGRRSLGERRARRDHLNGIGLGGGALRRDRRARDDLRRLAEAGVDAIQQAL